MGEHERQQPGKHGDRATRSVWGAKTDCENRPEQRMRRPHFRRRAEHQWQKASGRKTGIAKNAAAGRAIGRQRQKETEKGRGEKQQSIDEDAGARVAGQGDRGFGRNIGEDISE